MTGFNEADFEAKVAANILTEVFKSAWAGIASLNNWVTEKSTAEDFFGNHARRYGSYFVYQYNNMKILGMPESIPLDNIYIKVNILEKINRRSFINRKWVQEQLLFNKRGFIRDTISENNDDIDIPDEYDIFNHDLPIKKFISINDIDIFDGIQHIFTSLTNKQDFSQRNTQKPGIDLVKEKHNLIVLGQPGAGKSTFLKHIGIEAIKKDGLLCQLNKIPIFITLKRFADSTTAKTLLEFIEESFDVCNFPELGRQAFIEKILSDGNALVLFDGLDEVGEQDVFQIVKKIQDFTVKYYKSQFILSCRIAAFNHQFSNFKDVEMADFDKMQIEQFVKYWFAHDQTGKGVKCLNELNASEAIQELGKTPLLLTLLCITYDAAMAFPKNRSELYQEALDTLLKKWDSERGIKRQEIYKGLSLVKKQALLSEIAWQTFTQGDFFIKQKKLEDYIGAYIKNLPEVKQEELEINSQEILKSIEAQHGLLVERVKSIYSFSHLTFQEYFTARYITSKQTDKYLVESIKDHLTNPDWREVLFLIPGLLDKADFFLFAMKKQIDEINSPSIFPFLRKLNHVVRQTAENLNIFNILTIFRLKIETIQNILSFAYTGSIGPHPAYEGTNKLIQADVNNRDISVIALSSLSRTACLTSATAWKMPIELSNAYEQAIARTSALERAMVHEQTCDLGLARKQACDQILVHDKSQAKTLALTRAKTRARVLDLERTFERARSGAHSHNRTRAIERELERARASAHAHDISYQLLKSVSSSDIGHFAKYIYATHLLVDCLQGDAYIANKTRNQLWLSMLDVPE